MAMAATDIGTSPTPLLTLLFVEEDIPMRVFCQLDWKTLQALELTCSHIRQFIEKAKVWKKKFEKENPSYLDKTMDIDKRLKIERLLKGGSKDVHLGHKKLVIKLSNLDLNRMKGICTKQRMRSLPRDEINDQGFHGTYTRDMNCDNCLVQYYLADDDDEEVLKVFEIKSTQVSEIKVGSEDSYILDARILPVTTEKSKFGKIAVLLASDDEAGVEVYQFDENVKNYQLESKSLQLRKSQIGDNVNTVKFVSSNSLLLVGETCDTNLCVSFLTVQDDRLEMTLVGTKICSDAIPSMLIDYRFDDVQHDYLASYAKHGDDQIVKVYDLKTTNPGKLGDSLITAMWETNVFTEDSSPVVVTRMLLGFPNLFVGRSDGHCDIFNFMDDQHIRTLDPGFIEEEILRIVCFNDFLFCLTESGRLSAWDKAKAVSQEAEGEILLWEKHYRHWKEIMEFSVNNTEIVTLEMDQEHIVLFDFWNVEKKKGKKGGRFST